MDPLGIALENFDVIGRWRDQYTDVSNYAPTANKKGGRFPVDARTVHLDGRALKVPGPEDNSNARQREVFQVVLGEHVVLCNGS